MPRTFHRRMSLCRFLIEAEEVALRVHEDGKRLERISNGAVVRKTAKRIRGLVAEVRELEHERRAPRSPTPTSFARESVKRASRVAKIAQLIADLRGDHDLQHRLDQLRREHPLRARAKTVIACSLEAYAGLVREHARAFASHVEEDCAKSLERAARELRTRSALGRHATMERVRRTAARDALLAQIETILRDVRAAYALAG